MVFILLLISISSFCQAFKDHSKRTGYNWYPRHPNVSQFFPFLPSDLGTCLSLGYYYLFTSWEFSTPELADDFPLGFEWQQVSSSLQDFSQYSRRSQQCCSLDSLHPFCYFQVLQSLYQSFGDCTKNTNYNWYNRHFHVLQFFQFPHKVEVPLFTFFHFLSVVCRDSKVPNPASSLFFVDFYKVWSSGRD